MDNQTFLDKYIEATKMVFFSLTDDIVAIRDTELKYLTMTHKMVEHMGLNSAEKVLGFRPDEIENYLDNKIITKFNEQDLCVIKSKQRKVFLEVAQSGGKSPQIYCVHKTAVLNPDTGDCVAIGIQITNLYWPNPVKSLLKLHQVKGLLVTASNEKSWESHPLTDLQHAVLFLCLNNYSYSQIAVLLEACGISITAVRVNDYLEHLKLIFHVRTKTQLIEKALGLNYNAILPASLFNQISSIDISHDAARLLYSSEE